MAISLCGNKLTLGDIQAVAREGVLVELSPVARQTMLRARSFIDDLVDKGDPAYGVNTGFGKFAEIPISREQTAELQRNLIMSHSCGVGRPLSTDTVRAMMLLRANALAKGFSGVRVETVETLLAMLNAKVHPVVPEQGSLGASGDLAPLAHIVLVMLGEGEAEVDGEVLPGREALARRGIVPCTLAAKEGLALINGTQAMAANLSLAVLDSYHALQASFIAASLSHQALRGITAAFDERLSAIRPHPAQRKAATVMRQLLTGSSYVTRPGELRVQDAYALRCIPQVHGASWHALRHVEETLLVEINSATDNPLVFAEDREVLSGGNFHGQFLALAADYLAIAVAELASISERRIERLVNPQLSGLPPFLTRHGGLNSGFMITQYTAAALVSENKVLCHPASVDSIPSSANQEDHVSMGGIACRKVRTVIDNTLRVLGIEFLAACQAIDLQPPGKLSPASQAAYDALRQWVPTLNTDRTMYPDLNASYALLFTGRLQQHVAQVVGPVFDF